MSLKPTNSAPASFAALRRLAFGENKDAHLFAAAVGERAGAADHLVGLLRIDAEAEGKRDRLVELRRRQFLQGRNGLGQIVGLVAVHLFGGRAITFAAVFLHDFEQCERASCSPAFARPSLARDGEVSGDFGVVKTESALLNLGHDNQPYENSNAYDFRRFCGRNHNYGGTH